MTESIAQRMSADAQEEELAYLGTRPNASEYVIYRHKVTQGRYQPVDNVERSGTNLSAGLGAEPS